MTIHETAARFHVSTWHGEHGSMFEIKDRKHPDDYIATFSTITQGGNARLLADKKCLELNNHYGAQK